MSTSDDKKTPTDNTPKTATEPSKLLTGCCLTAFVVCGGFVGMVVGPIIAFQQGAGDFDFIGIGPGLLVGGFIGFIVGFMLLASRARNDN